jgi:hypothetical protein
MLDAARRGLARLDAGDLAALRGLATGAFWCLTGTFIFGSAATAVSASAVTVART